jgi:hypothetical protein
LLLVAAPPSPLRPRQLQCLPTLSPGSGIRCDQHWRPISKVESGVWRDRSHIVSEKRIASIFRAKETEAIRPFQTLVTTHNCTRDKPEQHDRQVKTRLTDVFRLVSGILFWNTSWLLPPGFRNIILKHIMTASPGFPEYYFETRHDCFPLHA